jgi:hypothetical protein
MGYTAKCPQCNEINSGSSLYCVKCQTSLVGIPREKDASVIENPEIKKTDNQVSKTTERSSNAHIKIGLIVGFVGFFVISFFTFGRGFCSGLFISIGMGYVSGFFTFRYANIGTIENASRLGAISGGIAGIFAALGQVFGGILPSLIFGFVDALGTFPNSNIDTAKELFSMFFVPSLFNGILGLVAASIAGSITASKSFS